MRRRGRTYAWTALVAFATLLVVARPERVVAGLADVVIDVAENIGVADAVRLLSPAVVSVSETVGVHDAVRILPAVVLRVAETVGVIDAVRLVPPAVITVSEPVVVNDAAKLVPAVFIRVAETVGVQDAVRIVPPVVISVSEQIGVIDAVRVPRAVIIRVVEGVTVADSATPQAVGTAPTILTPPSPQHVTAGRTAAFTVSATGTPPLTYRWQVSTNAITFTDIPGATAATLSFVAHVGDDGHDYRAVVTNTLGSATSSSGRLTVDALAQSITFGALPPRVYGDAPFTVSATGGGSGQPVTFTASGSCTIAVATVTIVAAGGCTITAHQAGLGDYAAAPDVARTFAIAKATPNIAWSDPAAVGEGTTLSSAQLAANATLLGATLAGTLAYTPAAGTTLADGPANVALSTTFTPADATNFTTATKTVHVIVMNLPPKITSLIVPTAPFALSTPASTRVTFTDPGTLDTHTGSWDWGDGTTSAGTVTEASGSGSATGSHLYARVGIYIVTVTVTDKDGGSAKQTAGDFVVAYDATSGFVTGGGWITSPRGAYALDPELTGRANFGFVSKYPKGQSVPSGNTDFQFQAAGLNFKSTVYDWLVVAGAKAQYKGSGTINGAGDYGFMLTAVDGQVNGGGGVDRFRIKIWDKASGAIVYDNQVAADDNATPTTSLGGGSIVIHN